jgi:tetratricopeptide (TPR) repeat protein
MGRRNALNVVAAFVLGATTVLVAKTKLTFDPKAFYSGHDKKEAAALLLAEGEKLAGDAMFDGVLGGKHDKNDLYRIATAYAAGENWDKARPLFEQAIGMDAGDDSGILKAACWFNLNGDRARAEELFGTAFAHAPDHAWHYILAAGSYLGVEPF